MRCFRGALLAVLGWLVVSPPLSAQQQPAVNGKNVRAVVYTDKAGKVAGVVSQGIGTTWHEDNANGRYTHTEIARDDWSVYLSKDDGALVQLDLYEKKLFWVPAPLSAAEKASYTTALRRKQNLYGIPHSYAGNATLTDSGAKPRTENTFRAVVYTDKAGKVVGAVSQAGVSAWFEHNANGRYALTEIARDDWSVYLAKADGALVQLDLYNKNLYWVEGPLSAAEKANYLAALKRKQALYTIPTVFKNKFDVAAAPAGPAPGGKRPFFVMGHHANTEKQVNDYVANGAVFIECDIHMYSPPFRFSGSDSIYVIHFANNEFTRQFTNSNDTDKYFKNIKAHMDSGKLSGLLLDVKNFLTTDGPTPLYLSYPNPRYYGAVVASTMKRAGIPASRVIMGVEQKATAGLATNADTWVDEFMKGVRWDAKYDCMLDMYVAASGDANTWANTLNAKSDVASTGMDSSIRGNFSGYKPYLEAAVQRRDAKSGDLRFTYFWTVNDEGDMRKALDVGVSGILTDKPDLLKKIASEPAYQAKFRLATGADLPIAAADRVKRSLDDPFEYVTLKHQGGYIARFTVTWKDPQGKPQTYASGSTTLGWSVLLNFPRGCTNINVHAQADVIFGTWRDIYNGPLTPGSYTASGTTLNRKWSRN